MGAGAPPSVERTADEWLAEVKRLEQEGELLRAYDVAAHGLAQHPGDLPLKHRAVLCLASTGATHQAKELFAALGLAGAAEPSSPALRMNLATLEARLLQDEALG